MSPSQQQYVRRSEQQQQHRTTVQNLNDKVSARFVLYFLSWSGFLVSFMMRNDINFAIVEMVVQPSSEQNEHNLTISQLINETSIHSTTVAPLMSPSYFAGRTTGHEKNYSDPTTTASSNSNVFSIMTNELVNNDLNMSNNRDVFDWSTTVQTLVISSFYWCYVLSQVVGGVATQHFGTKCVFGWSQFVTAICSLCIPYGSDIHYVVLIVLRSIQGFASGLTWPAMYAIVAHWIPPSERSRFMSSFQGFSIGIGLTYPLCGFIIANYGWRPVFYTTGITGIVWSIFWYLLAFNKPSEHPRITHTELNYIESNKSDSIKNSNSSIVPWRQIFLSLPVWAIGITTFGRIWINYTLLVSGPSFMKNILGLSIQNNGLLSGLPFLCSYFTSVVFCNIADRLITNFYMSLKNVRKMMTGISQIVPGLLVLPICYLCKVTNSIYYVYIIWFIAVVLITASYAGAMANIVDIAPNLAGPVLAFAQTIHMTASFMAPIVNGFIVNDARSLNDWKNVYNVASIIAIATYIMYQIYGTGDVQKWNYPIDSNCNHDNNINIIIKKSSKTSSSLSLSINVEEPNSRCINFRKSVKNSNDHENNPIMNENNAHDDKIRNDKTRIEHKMYDDDNKLLLIYPNKVNQDSTKSQIRCLQSCSDYRPIVIIDDKDHKYNIVKNEFDDDRETLSDGNDDDENDNRDKDNLVKSLKRIFVINSENGG